MTAHITKHLAVTAGCLCVVAALGLGTYAQAACAPGKDGDAPAIEWTPELDCTATCHGAQAEAMANEDTQGAPPTAPLPASHATPMRKAWSKVMPR